MEESFVNSCINTAFDTENMYELDTKPLPFITGKWNYLGKIHIKRSLRRSFAYKVVNKQKIYCILDYCLEEKDIPFMGIEVDKNNLIVAIENIIESNDDDWCNGPM